MTLSHTLAQRLVRLWVAAVIGTCLMTACKLPPARPTGPPDAVVKLALSPTSLSLLTDRTADFVVVALTATDDTVDVSVNWTTNGGSIAPMSDVGGVQYARYRAPLQPGMYKVFAQISASGIADSSVVDVSAVPVASVSVTPISLSLTGGQTGQLTASPLDASGNPLAGRVVTWTSSSAAIATVSGSGLVTGQGSGTATITATSEGQSGSATVTVVAVPIATVSVTPTSLSLTVGQTGQLTATPRDASGNPLTGRVITWTSNSAVVATVNSNGLVTARGAGTATITASSEGQSGSATVTVVPVPVASVSVTPTSLSLTVGQTGQLTATPRDASGNPLTGRVVTWGTSSAAVATVSGSGLVTAQGAGTATITATSEGKSGTATVTVTTGSGVQTLLSEGFDDQALANRGWYDNTGARISTVEKHSGTGSLEVHWTTGSTNPVGLPGAMRRLFTGSPTLYVSYWVKYSTNYVGSGQPYQPHEFAVTSDRDDPYSNPTLSYLFAYIEQTYQNGGVPVLRMQDAKMIDTTRINVDLTGVTENRAVAGCNGNPDGTSIISCFPLGGAWYNGKEWWANGVAFRPNPGVDYKGNWNHVEVYFQLNSIVAGIGQKDGIARYWLNGNLKIEYTNLMFRTGANPNIKFNQFLITPYIGDGSPADQYMWVDDLVLATTHP